MSKSKLLIIIGAVLSVVVAATSIVFITTLKEKDVDITHLTFVDQTYEYDGLEHNILINGDLPEGITIEYKNNTLINVGSVKATATIKEGEKVLKTLNATLAITQREVTLKPNDIMIEQNSEIVFNGYTILKGSIIDKDLSDLNIQYSLSDETINSTIGFFENVVNLTHTENNNYNITVQKGNLKVVEKLIDLSLVTFVDKTITYNGNNHEILVSNLPEGVTVKYYIDVLEFTGKENVGEYLVRACFTPIEEGAFVSVSELYATLKIEKRIIVGSVNPQTIKYGSDLSSLDITYSWGDLLIIDDDYNTFNFTYELDESINSNSVVGFYENVISITYTENENYDITINNGSLIIEKGDFNRDVVSFNDGVFSYDGLEHSLLMENTLPEEFEIVYIDNVQTKAGIYIAKLLISSPNYNEIDEFTALLEIVKDGKYHDVTFDYKNGEILEYVVPHGTLIPIIPQLPEKYGYVYDWNYELSKPIVEDTYIDLISEKAKFSIEYNLGDVKNDPRNLTEYSFDSGIIVLYPPITSVGRTFISWHTDPSLSNESIITNIDASIVKDITLYPNFVNYKIESAPGFVFNEDDYELPAITMICSYTKTLVTLSTTIKVSDGCTWILSYDIEGKEGIPTKNMSLSIGHNKAFITIWYKNLYNVVYILDIYRLDMKDYNFIVDGEIYTNDTVEELTLIDEPAQPVKRGYDFIGWYENGDIEQTIIEFPYQIQEDVQLIAKFTPTVYNLKYHLDEGTNNELNPSTYTLLDHVRLYNPTKRGYSFMGWYLEDTFENKVEGIAKNTINDIELYAKFIPINYNIYYDLDEGINNELNPSTYTLLDQVELQEPSRKGHTFDGWYLDESFETKIEKIEVGTIEDIYLYAKFTPIVYNINYDLDEGTNNELNPSTYTVLDQVVLQEPSRKGHTFDGWYLDESFETKIEKIEVSTIEDISLYAKFTLIVYNINYDLDKGTNHELNPSTYTVLDQVVLQEPSRKGHTFDGWYLDESFETKIEKIEVGTIEDISLYAKFTPINYNIDYDLDEGTNHELNPSTYTILDELTLLDPTKRGYTFIGWYLDESFETKIEKINLGTIEDIYLYAKFTPIVYNINYDLDKGTNHELNPSTYTILDQVVLQKPSRKGHTFDGWYLEESFETKIEKIKVGTIEDISLYAKFIPINYNIDYDLDKGTNHELNPSTYTILDEVTLLDPTKRGYTFIGWYLDESFETKIEKIKLGTIEDIYLYAKFTPTVYNIKYDLDEGTNNELNPSTYTILDEVTLLDPTKRGYTFIGWYLEESFETKIEQIEVGTIEDIYLYAKFTPIVYNIDYDLDEGTNNELNPSTYTILDEVTLLNPTKRGYTFIGWYLDESFETKIEKIKLGTIEDIYLYAKFTPTVYNINYDLDEGTNHELNPSTYTVLDQVVLQEPSRKGHTFDGWYLEESFETKIEKIEVGTIEDINVYAKFVINTYTINYYVGSEIITIDNCSFGSNYQIKEIKVYGDDYEIFSWYADNSNYDFSEIIEYDFDYDLNLYAIAAYSGDDYTYSITNDNASITKYKGSSTVVNLPSYIKKDNQYYQVTSIGSSAFEGCRYLKNINVPDSIISIGDYAFRDCYNLTTIRIPDSVTSIGDCAFRECYNLTTIRIPDSVTSIDSYAFFGCSSLESIVIPNSVTSIGDYAFEYCSSLASITIPNSVTSIGDYTFCNCSSLASITIPNSVTSIGDYTFCNCSSLASITIPNSVTSIGSSAFYNCDSLTSIVIPNSVTSIGEKAFYECDSLTSIVIPNSVTSIGSSAFAYCSRLANIEIPNSVTSIGSYAFVDCSSLESIVIPNSVTSIGSSAFAGCSSLVSITIPNSVTFIGDYTFAGCSSLASITIPNSVTSIGRYVFSKCTSLESIVIPNSVTSIGDSTFYNCSSLKSVIIPNSVTSIGDSTFYNCSSLASITIPNSVTSIGRYVFSECSSLESIVIPNSVASIGDSTFYNCSSLESVIISNSVTSIGDYTFYDCSRLANIEIPNSVTSIGRYVFFECSSLESIVIPNSVTSIGDYALLRCSSLENVYYSGTIDDWCNIEFHDSGSNPMCNASNFFMLNESNEYFVVTDLVIPDTITSIGHYQFYGFKILASITIPNSVTSIGSSAFEDCSSLESIVIPNSVTSIGSSAFYNCSSLENVYYSGTIDDWCNIKFHDSSSNPMRNASNFFMLNESNEYFVVTDLVIPDTITSIGNYQLYGFKILASITIPNSVTSIGSSAFAYCSRLANIEIPNSVTSIGSSAFHDCSSLASITIPNSITFIGDYTFAGCSSLASITIPNSVTMIGRYVFSECSSLESIVIPNSVTSIGYYAFEYCSSLASITIPNSVTFIGDYTFAGCSSLASITIPNSLTNIERYAFSECSSLESIVIPNSVASIGYAAFQGCRNLTIYCEATSKPSGWHSSWNSWHCPVVWGYNK